MNRDVAGLEEDDDGRWRRRTGHSVEGLQWGERKDVRGSICQPLSRVPAGFYLQLPAYWLLLNIQPAAVDGSYTRIWLSALPLCPQTINN
jgi:hypothetical protein